MTDDEENLHRIIERLDSAARTTAAAAKQLAHDLDETRLLAAEDRIQISRLILLVQRLTQQGQITLGGTQRLEQAAAHVAQDLAASIGRADQTPTEKPGAGADAALRSAGETAAEVASHAETPEDPNIAPPPTEGAP